MTACLVYGKKSPTARAGSHGIHLGLASPFTEATFAVVVWRLARESCGTHGATVRVTHVHLASVLEVDRSLQHILRQQHLSRSSSLAAAVCTPPPRLRGHAWHYRSHGVSVLLTCSIRLAVSCIFSRAILPAQTPSTMSTPPSCGTTMPRSTCRGCFRRQVGVGDLPANLVAP